MQPKQIPAWVSVILLLVQFATGFVAYGRLQQKIDSLEYEVHLMMDHNYSNRNNTSQELPGPRPR